MDKIFIKNLEVFAHHGVFLEEKKTGQNFIFSAEIELGLQKAGLSDDLSSTVSYADICILIDEIVRCTQFDLLESLGEYLTKEILITYPKIKKIDLEISKPEAPIDLKFESVGIKISRSWHNSYISIGSNMGNKRGFLDSGIKKINNLETCEVINIAEYIQTKPYGPVKQDDFINTVVEIRTLLAPENLLTELQKIEDSEGRERTIKWGPRTLDLDILFYDDSIINTGELVVPHPEISKREFVLKPLMEIAPQKKHPITQNTPKEMLLKIQE